MKEDLKVAKHYSFMETREILREVCDPSSKVIVLNALAPWPRPCNNLTRAVFDFDKFTRGVTQVIQRRREKGKEGVVVTLVRMGQS